MERPDASTAAGTGWMFALYLLLLVWAPIPLASNRPWGWAILEIWVFALALWWLTGYFSGARSLNTVVAGAKPVLLCASAWAIYAWLQLVPLPIGLLGMLSPESARWHA